jgi:hypothetical protein
MGTLVMSDTIASVIVCTIGAGLLGVQGGHLGDVLVVNAQDARPPTVGSRSCRSAKASLNPSAAVPWTGMLKAGSRLHSAP